MVIRKYLDIINVFRKNPLKELTFNEVMRLSGKKSRNWVFNVLKKFAGEDVLIKKKINNSFLYKANLNSPLLLSYFHIFDFADAHIKNSKLPFEPILEILRNVQRTTPFFILLIFGSYAAKKNKKDSDIDMAFIVESDDTGKKIKPHIERIVRRNIHEIDYHIITKDDFKEMLLREEENLGKEIYGQHFIIWGNDQYYELIKEAEENGFKG